ncbi:MAG: LSM domain-containing protein [Candidatus Hodarchaeales archaeon]
MSKPLDVLHGALNKTILLRLRGNRELKGVLKSYDMHLNLVLEDVELMSNEEGAEPEKLGRIILRGDNVVLISPP